MAAIDFSNILVGKHYSRNYLADLWQYESYHALSRGVVTPTGSGLVILFVTKEKQNTATQYEDHIDQDILFWEGEDKHGSDARIISKIDDVRVFYRERHHMDFTYCGRAILEGYLLFKDRPSKFTFRLLDQRVTAQGLVEEIRSSYGITETEKAALILSRRGQGVYRKKSVDLWKTCCVTGFSKTDILVASHIKPWKLSRNEERIDPFNSLLLVPTLDNMFDKGYITFENGGSIIISEKISEVNLTRIGIDRSARLKKVPGSTREYLEYHREYIFNCISAVKLNK